MMQISFFITPPMGWPDQFTNRAQCQVHRDPLAACLEILRKPLPDQAASDQAWRTAFGLTTTLCVASSCVTCRSWFWPLGMRQSSATPVIPGCSWMKGATLTAASLTNVWIGTPRRRWPLRFWGQAKIAWTMELVMARSSPGASRAVQLATVAVCNNAWRFPMRSNWSGHFCLMP